MPSGYDVNVCICEYNTNVMSIDKYRGSNLFYSNCQKAFNINTTIKKKDVSRQQKDVSQQGKHG